MASHECCARDEDWQDTQHKDPHQQSNQNQLGLRVAKIQGPPKTVTLFDKQSRIVGIVVKEASIPVPIIIAENGGSWLTISGRARFCPGTLRMPEQDENEDNKESPDEQENESRHAHRYSSFKARRC
jgi:hypothetical protein